MSGGVPNANSPGLLTRLLEMVARGVRSSRGLQEALGVRQRTAQYYVRAGEWLDLLSVSGPLMLTPRGLEYVYTRDRRPALYAAAVWDNPLARQLLRDSDGALPEVEVVAETIAAVEPELAPTTVRRRASAVRSLIEPAVGVELPRRVGAQLEFALPVSARLPPAPHVDVAAGREYNADVYRYLLTALVDHGELSLGEVRALLDRAATGLPLGGYVELALARGDAERVDEHLVVTPACLARPHLRDSAAAVILSDSGYRGYLEAVRGAAAGDPVARVRRDSARPHYRRWDARLFGRPADSATLDADLSRVLLDRSLDAFPVCTTAPSAPPVDRPFLEVWRRDDLLVAAPAYLAHLMLGLGVVNRDLAAARHASGVAEVPSLASRVIATHAGLLYPGEPLPRAVPDLRSLRMRLVRRAPYPALLVALLLLHRARPDVVEVVSRRGAWSVRRGSGYLGPVLEVLDALARSRGWHVSRARGLTAEDLVRALEVVGLVQLAGNALVLAEPFFAALRLEVEEAEVAGDLQELEGAVEGWLLTARLAS